MATPALGRGKSRWGRPSVAPAVRSPRAGAPRSHGAELHQAAHRILVQGVLAGEAQDVHGAAVRQRAARQHPGRRGRFLRGQELVAHVLLFQGQYVCERGLGGEVGHGGGRRGLPQRQASAGRAQARLPGQVQLVAGEAGLALQQGRGRGLQNEFGALNALVLVALESGREPAKRRREELARGGEGRGHRGQGGAGYKRERNPLVTPGSGRAESVHSSPVPFGDTWLLNSCSN